MDTGSDGAQRQSRLTRKAMDEAGLGTRQVWLYYLGLTGIAGEAEIDAYLNGLMPLPPNERDIVSHAVNELAADRPSPLRAPYTADLEDGGPAT